MRKSDDLSSDKEGVSLNRRDAALDALRGLAALQVLFCHFFLGFLPELAMAGPGAPGVAGLLARSPLAFLWDGASAVCLFFILSGYVLAGAFKTGMPALAYVAGRWSRLAVPALLSIVFCAVLYASLGHPAAKVLAMEPTKGWLHLSLVPLGDMEYLFWDWVRSWSVGVQSTGPGWHLGLSVLNQENTYNSVLWTMSLEFVGSLLILGLTRLDGSKRDAACVLLLIVLSGTYYFLFVAGFLLASTKRGKLLKGSLPSWASILLLCAGLWACHAHNIGAERFFSSMCQAMPGWILSCHPNYHAKMYGAALVFLSVYGSASALMFMGRPSFKTIGDMSFTLYLTHIPVIVSVSCPLALWLIPRIGLNAALATAMLVGLETSLFVAWLAVPVDKATIRFAKFVKERTAKLMM
jgi:peptidoglycan/LPS O-acetylase OafA/YrhL